MERVDTVIVDKTGTLTIGRPEVTSVQPLSSIPPDQSLALAAAVELQSEHPLAQAVVRRAHTDRLKLPQATDFQSVPGGGVAATVEGHAVLIGQAEFLKSRGVSIADNTLQLSEKYQRRGNTTILVAIDGSLATLLAVSDPIKPTTPAALKSLRDLGLRVVMLTGDSEATARAVADELGIDDFQAEVSPQDKHRHIRELRQQGHVVAMAGDGINDAPALAEADVGIAMGTGTGVAIESAGITLVGGDLRGLAAAMSLSRKMMRNIRQNLFFAFGYNALGIPLAAGLLYPLFGVLLSPMIAAAAMSFSSVSVIANALRLRNAQI